MKVLFAICVALLGSALLVSAWNGLPPSNEVKAALKGIAVEENNKFTSYVTYYTKNARESGNAEEAAMYAMASYLVESINRIYVDATKDQLRKIMDYTLTSYFKDEIADLVELRLRANSAADERLERLVKLGKEFNDASLLKDAKDLMLILRDNTELCKKEMDKAQN